MIRVTIGNNLSRKAVIIDETTTLRTALENNKVDCSIGMNSLDGSILSPGDLDKTFADFGITEKCYLFNIVKADNAAIVKLADGTCVIEPSETLGRIKLLKERIFSALKLHVFLRYK